MNGRVITVVVSVVVHGALALAALTASDAKKRHEATTVSVMDEEKKKAEPPKPPPPPPPPPVAPPPPPPEHVAKVAPTPEVAPPPETAPAPEPQTIDTGYGNGDGTGPAIAAHKDEPKIEPKPVKPPPKAVKLDKPPPPPPPVSSDGVCTEPPGKPEPERKTEIEYTDEARASGVEGRLVLKVTVDDKGNVTKVEVVSSVDPQLDAAAIATVKTWHFKPALACGKPVAGGTYTLARKFELSD